MNLEKRIKVIRAKYEKDMGKQIPEETWQGFIDDWFPGGLDSDEDLEDLDANLSAALKNARKLAPLLLKNTGSKRQSENDTATKKRSKKWFERRLYLVNFITGRALNPKRKDWERLCDEWNKEHPSDIMTPKVLKVEYHRAKAEADVQGEYVKRKYPQRVKEIVSLAEDSSLVQDRMWGELGRIALFQGEAVVAGTAGVMKILQYPTVPGAIYYTEIVETPAVTGTEMERLESRTILLDGQDVVDFSVHHKARASEPTDR